MTPQRFPGFQGAVLAEFGTVPKRYLAAVSVLGLVSSTVTAAVIRVEPEAWVWMTLLGSLAIAYVWLSYATTMAMLPAKSSWVGAIKFAGTGVALIVPSLLTFGLLLLIGRSSWLLGLALFLAVVAFTILVLPMLAGWPVLQATSARWIGPRGAFRRTRGIRWKLVMASLILSGVNRGIPRAAPSDDLWIVALMVLFEAVVSTISVLLLISVSVAAWRHMTAGDSKPSFGRSPDEVESA